MRKSLEKHIAQGTLSWIKWSAEIVRKYPDLFDPDKFDWIGCSATLVINRPELFDPDKFNWGVDTAILLAYQPELFSPEHFPWKGYSLAVIFNAMEYIQPDKIGWFMLGRDISKLAEGQYKDMLPDGCQSIELLADGRTFIMEI